jgi:metal-responsive CopG/Arc/MetJ family transcriptional regulator
MKTTMQPITLKVPLPLLAQADFIAHTLGFSRAELIRRALAKDLQTYGKAVAEVQSYHKELSYRYQEWLRSNNKK